VTFTICHSIHYLFFQCILLNGRHINTKKENYIVNFVTTLAASSTAPRKFLMLDENIFNSNYHQNFNFFLWRPKLVAMFRFCYTFDVIESLTSNDSLLLGKYMTFHLQRINPRPQVVSRVNNSIYRHLSCLTSWFYSVSILTVVLKYMTVLLLFTM